jgi:hypothetical protein
MKWLILMAVLVSCGTKNRVDVSGTVKTTAPTDFYLHQEDVNVNHKISIDTSQFEESCTKKYKDINDSEKRNKKIDECVSEKERIVSELLKTLTVESPEDE